MDWNQIVGELGPRLYNYFCASFAADMASDFVQETLIRLVRKHREGAIDEQKGSLRMFAFGIAHYVRLENLKLSVTFQHLSVDYIQIADLSANAEGQLEISQRSTDLRNAIKSLSPIQQDIILLLIDEDLSMDEISHIVKQPINTVKSHIHRAKETLKKILNKELS